MIISNGMDRKKLSIRLVSLIVFFFLINSLANYFYWFYSIWWFDMPMHFLGGFWWGLVFVWFYRVEEISPASIFGIILSVLFVGVLWEIFEFFFYNFIAQNSFNILDTISDVCLDLAGAFFALMYFKLRMDPVRSPSVN